MDRKKKRWLLGCGCGVLGLCVLGGLTFLGWAVMERRKPGPVVEVVTYHPGMSASSIEKTITNRIERWVNQAEGSEKVTSRSLAGVSIVRVTFRNDVDPASALPAIQQLANGTLPMLPPDTLPPVTFLHDPRQNRPIGAVTASGSTAEKADLKDAIRLAVRNQLSAAEGTIVPNAVFGRQDRKVSFYLDGRPAVPIYLAWGAKAKTSRENILKQLNASWVEEIPPKLKLRWVPFGAEDKGWRSSDDSLLTIYLRGPSNVRLEETEKRAAAVKNLVEKTIPANEREAIVSEVGLIPDVSVAYSANAGPMDATIHIQLSAARTQSAAAYAAKLRGLLHDDARFADLRFFFASQDMPPPVNIRVNRGTTRNAKEARRFAEDVVKRLATGIKGAVDCEIVQRLDAPTLTIRVDARKAADVGVGCREVIAQVAAALKLPAPSDSELHTDVVSGDQSATMLFRLQPGVDVGAVTDAKVVGGKAEFPVKLSALTTLQRGTTAIEIDHEDLLPVLNVRANIEGRDRGDVVADIRKMLTELPAPEGLRVELVD